MSAELAHRTSRPPDLEAENRALRALARALATDPSHVLHTVAQTVVELCRADSAGVSIPEQDGEHAVLRWRATSGALDGEIATVAPEAIPWSDVPPNQVLLIQRAGPALRDLRPPIHEHLLATWAIDDKPGGALWAIAHTPERKFDAEDARLLSSLVPFAAAAWQITSTVLDRDRARSGLRKSEEALEHSEERLRLTVESVTDYALLTLDVNGRIISWNSGAERVFGYAEQEVLGQPTDIVFTPEDRESDVPRYEMWLAREQGRAADERWHLRKDGTRVYVSGVLSPVRRDGGIAGYVKIVRDLTQQRRADDMLREAHQLLERRVAERTSELAASNESLRQEAVERQLTEASRRRLLRQLVNAQEHERRRISRELHDQLGQQVSVLGLKLAMLTQRPQVEGEVKHELDGLAEIVRELDTDLEFLVRELRPTALDDLGLVSALTDYVNTWSARIGVAASFEDSDLHGLRVPPEIETVLYRIVQEALTNVAKHARASQVDVVIRRTQTALALTISDNGIGFARDEVDAGERRGVGLLSMSERASLVGGTAHIESTPAKGTVVTVLVPLRIVAASNDGVSLVKNR